MGQIAPVYSADYHGKKVEKKKKKKQGKKNKIH